MRVAASGARVRLKAATIAAAAIFAAVEILLAAAYYADGAKRLIGDEQSYQTFALAILGGGSWMPSTIWPPLQPIAIAAVYAIAGVHIAAVQIVQTILFVGCALLLRAIWRHVDGSVRAANCAAALFVLNPANAAYAYWLWPEVTHLFLVLLVFWLLIRRPSSRIAAAAAGFCSGLALLAKSLLAGFWPAFLLAFFSPARPRFRVVSAALFLCGIAIATAPALWHGWREFGRPMIADSSMYNLWIGLTDRWRVDYVDDQGGITLAEFLASGATPAERNLVYRQKVEALVSERGVARVAADQLGRQYFRLFSAKTPLVSQLPGPACAGHLCVYSASPVLAQTLTFANDAFHTLMLTGCAFGIACWRRRPDIALALIGACLAYQLALMGVLHVKARFLFPMIPFLCAFAGSFYSRLANPRTVDGQAPIGLGIERLVFGGAIAGLLLGLAFAGPALDGLCAT